MRCELCGERGSYPRCDFCEAQTTLDRWTKTLNTSGRVVPIAMSVNGRSRRFEAELSIYQAGTSLYVPANKRPEWLTAGAVVRVLFHDTETEVEARVSDWSAKHNMRLNVTPQTDAQYVVGHAPKAEATVTYTGEA